MSIRKFYRLSVTVTLAVFSFTTFNPVGAQEVNFTQYAQTPLITNPSFVGTQNVVSATIHHRSQELTQNVSLNSSMLTLVVPLLDEKRTRRWGGWGLSAMHNTLSNDKSFVLQGLTGAYAYNLPLYRDHYLSFGMQMGYFQRKVALDGYTTGSQWNNANGFDPNAGLGENISGETKGYLTGAAGFTYYIQDQDGRQLFYAGGSVFNLNKPNISITENEEIASLRYSGQLGVALIKNEKLTLGPEFLYLYDNSLSTYHIGARASYYIKNENPFDILHDGRVDFKAGYRVNNSITLETQFYQPNFSVGFSYDIAVVSATDPGVFGNTFEITLSLRKLIKQKEPYKAKAKEYSNIGDVRRFYFNNKPNENITDDQDIEQETEDEINPLKQFGEGTFKFKLKKDFKFGLNDAILNKDAKNYLNEMVSILKNSPNVSLEVIGHTDNTGSKATNKRVAIQRAMSVVDYLVDQGIDRNRLKITAMGATQPLAPNDSEENRAINRRVEFILYSE